MAVLNLRNVPDDLVRDLKKAALDAGEPFHPYCIGLLKLALLHGLHIRVVAAKPYDPGPAPRRHAHGESVGTSPDAHAAVKVEIT